LAGTGVNFGYRLGIAKSGGPDINVGHTGYKRPRQNAGPIVKIGTGLSPQSARPQKT
jgi:hypothetical protein